VNLGFKEPWAWDMFALGFDKHVKLHRGLSRMNLGFDEPLENRPGMRPSWILVNFVVIV